MLHVYQCISFRFIENLPMNIEIDRSKPSQETRAVLRIRREWPPSRQPRSKMIERPVSASEMSEMKRQVGPKSLKLIDQPGGV